ncbi:hypothetical protein C9374_007328 [Naegleria lovaniensis]|uniref:Arrestin-like N-terminal domain-containing protein n=1 Tax=Naegleria lovaniensis TaxID=51637 RepID=A0AA88GKI2_NAELO|nr:uncharacterized protein C9374_007328 [Naegleria lovaniensis]KAG2379189.1 hypothetical protein C9374_007328 [Naegleria lovaniensis]
MCEYSEDRLQEMIDVKIKLNREWFSDNIEGDILVEIKPTCKAKIRVKDITLFLQGLEKLEYQVEENRKLVWKTEENKALQQEISIAGDGNLPKGSYVYSFSERLPNGLPGSFFEETTHLGKQIKARISYFASCVVELLINREKESQFVTIHQQFEVFEKVGDKIAKNLFASRINQSCGLLWKISSQKDIFCRKEACRFYSEIVNEGQMSVSNIDVKLFQVLYLKTPNNIGGTPDRIMMEICKKNYTGVLARCKDMRNITFVLSPTLPNYFLYPQTTNGTLIRTEFILRFSLDNLVDINVPIQIVFKQDIHVRPQNRGSVILSDNVKSNNRKSKSFYGEIEDYETDHFKNPKEDDHYHEVVSLEKKTGCCTLL